MAKRIWLGVQNGSYAGLAGLQNGTAYEVSDEQWKACKDYWGDEVKETPHKDDKKEVTE